MCFVKQHTESSCTLVLPPLSIYQTLDPSFLKDLAEDNSKFDENGRKFSKRLEITVGKGVIARYGHFLFFQQWFQKTNTADIYKRTMMVLYRSPEHICNLYGLSRAGY